LISSQGDPAGETEKKLGLENTILCGGPLKVLTEDEEEKKSGLSSGKKEGFTLAALERQKH